MLAVKENQGQLHERIRDLFEGAEALGFDGEPYDHTETVDKGHGRVERRECWVISEPDCRLPCLPGTQGQWPPLKAAVWVVGHRQTADDGASPATTSVRQRWSRLGGTTAGRRQKPLEHRRLGALDPGRDLSGRPAPNP